jgi:hypothetical protein
MLKLLVGFLEQIEEVSRMIHRDLCNPTNTKNYSPLRMQFHFLLSRYVCWDGFIPLTRKEMADLLSCDIQSIHKFIKKGVRESVLSLEGDRLYLLKKVDEYTEGYVKHYPFLESTQFKALSIHAQRFILYTLWTGVHTGRPLKRDLSTLYHSANQTNGVLNLYSRAPIYSVLEEAKTFLNLEIIVQKGREMVRVTSLQDPFSQQRALENQGEMKLLEDTLDANNCDELVSLISREQILKLKKHCVRTLHSIGIELFSHALRKLLSLHKLFELNNHGEIGVYLKAILNDLEQKILPTLQKRIDYAKKAIIKTQNLLVTGSTQWVQGFESKLDKLTKIVQFISQKTKGNNLFKGNKLFDSFPFYNWLEME